MLPELHRLLVVLKVRGANVLGFFLEGADALLLIGGSARELGDLVGELEKDGKSFLSEMHQYARDKKTPNLTGVLPLRSQPSQPLLLSLQIRHSLLADTFDVIKGLGVLGSFEDIIELLFEHRSLGERPVRVLLMTEDDVIQDGFGYS